MKISLLQFRSDSFNELISVKGLLVVIITDSTKYYVCVNENKYCIKDLYKSTGNILTFHYWQPFLVNKISV
jgi:hypothetical protein